MVILVPRCHRDDRAMEGLIDHNSVTRPEVEPGTRCKEINLKVGTGIADILYVPGKVNIGISRPIIRPPGIDGSPIC